MKYGGLAALSAAVLLLEITLTRIYSVTQGYHFAFLAVSLGLLGFGVSGTILFTMPQLWRRAGPRLLWVSALLFILTALGSYWAINRIPFDAYRLVLEPRMFLHLALFYLAPVVPFFFAGLALGGSISLEPKKAGGLYGASLVGAGIGALLALAGPAASGLAGAVGVVVALGVVASLAFTLASWARRLWLPVGIGLVVVVGGWWLAGQVDLRLSPYKALPQVLRQRDAELTWTQWNAFSRVDVVKSEGLHQAPGLSFSYSQALPTQTAFTVDWDNLSSLSSIAAEEAVFTEYLPTAVAHHLLQEPRVLVVEPGGGLDVLTALHGGAAEVLALVGNPLEAELLRGRFADEAGGTFTDPRVRVVVGNPRSYLAREGERFDLVVISLREAFRPVTAGAYSLAENHLYAREAFQAYFRHVDRGGLLMVARWVQTPPSEELRMMATVVEALEDLGVEELENKLAALRTLQTLTLVAKKEPFTPLEGERLRTFADALQFDLSYLPGLRPGELNRFFVLPEEVYYSAFQRLLEPAEREQLYREHPFNVAPATDERPFFFHFFRWRQVPDVLGQLGKEWQPFGGAGFLVVLAFLAVAVVVSTGMILVPLLLRRAEPRSEVGGGLGRRWGTLIRS